MRVGRPLCRRRSRGLYCVSWSARPVLPRRPPTPKVGVLLAELHAETAGTRRVAARVCSAGIEPARAAYEAAVLPLDDEPRRCTAFHGQGGRTCPGDLQPPRLAFFSLNYTLFCIRNEYVLVACARREPDVADGPRGPRTRPRGWIPAAAPRAPKGERGATSRAVPPERSPQRQGGPRAARGARGSQGIGPSEECLASLRRQGSTFWKQRAATHGDESSTGARMR